MTDYWCGSVSASKSILMKYVPLSDSTCVDQTNNRKNMRSPQHSSHCNFHRKVNIQSKTLFVYHKSNHFYSFEKCKQTQIKCASHLPFNAIKITGITITNNHIHTNSNRQKSCINFVCTHQIVLVNFNLVGRVASFFAAAATVAVADLTPSLLMASGRFYEIVVWLLFYRTVPLTFAVPVAGQYLSAVPPNQHNEIFFFFFLHQPENISIIQSRIEESARMPSAKYRNI